MGHRLCPSTRALAVPPARTPNRLRVVDGGGGGVVVVLFLLPKPSERRPLHLEAQCRVSFNLYGGVLFLGF